jgi:uncharacterized membrane protein
VKPANLSIRRLLDQGWRLFMREPGLCIGIWLIYLLFGGGGGSSGSGGSIGLDLVIVGAAMTANVTSLLIGPPIRVGFQMTMLRQVRGDESVGFSDIFNGFDHFKEVFLTALLMGLIVFAGLLCCVVPGIILHLGLWPALLLVMEDGLEPREALREAWALTRGYKLQLFVYGLVVFVLQVLGTLCCCVGLVVVAPVTELGWMRAYEELRRARYGRLIEAGAG